MDLELSEDQEFFRATTRKFLEAECPLTTVRELEHSPDGFDRSWWRRGADLGWTSMLVAEEHGGGNLSGGGVCDLAIVAEEMGRMVSPGPLVPANLVAAAISRSGTDEQRTQVLPGLLSGELVAAWAFQEPGARWRVEDLACEAQRTGDGWRLRGCKAPVEAAGQATHLLVVARTDDGPAQFLVPVDADGVEVTPMESVDLVRRFARVDLEEVSVPGTSLVGSPGGAGDDVEWLLQVGAVLHCAETAGATARVLELTLEYLGDRYSFGRPLSSYQALKHRAADMKMWLEGCHAASDAAAREVQDHGPRAEELSSAAKAYVGTYAVEIIQDCVQLHGGIGVTWEHDLHLYLRRATLDRAMYGSPVEHRERVAQLLGMGAAGGGASR